MVATLESSPSSHRPFLVSEIGCELGLSRQGITVQVALWRFGLRVLRDYEDDLLLADRMPSEASPDHRAMLTLLMGAGENLLAKLEGSQPELGPLREQVRAGVERLRQRYAMWYMPMSEERASELMNEVFGVQS